MCVLENLSRTVHSVLLILVCWKPRLSVLFVSLQSQPAKSEHTAISSIIPLPLIMHSHMIHMDQSNCSILVHPSIHYSTIMHVGCLIMHVRCLIMIYSINLTSKPSHHEKNCLFHNGLTISPISRSAHTTTAL